VDHNARERIVLHDELAAQIAESNSFLTHVPILSPDADPLANSLPETGSVVKRMFVMKSSLQFSSEQVSDSYADSDSLPERYCCAVKDGIASYTARNVAARRLGFARVPADYGYPDADLALAGDVADGLVPAQSRMGEYIRSRTAFFDRVVVAALNAGMSQVVVGAAGYDGRSLRYAKPGVRWFEVDHPATQGDKVERLARLGIDAGHVQFVAADFTKDPVASRLLEAGLDARRPALFLFEGIAVYLEDSVTESVLAQFRAVTVAGSPLAISVSVTSGTAGRSAFRARVAAMGEPARSVMGPEEAEVMLARAGWQVSGGRATAGGGRAPGAGGERAVVDGSGQAGRADGLQAAGGDEAEPDRQARRLAAGLLTARAVAGAPRVRSVSGPPVASGPPVLVRRPAAGDAGTGDSARGAGRLSLPALLSRVLVAFTIEADNEAEHRLPHWTTTYGSSPGGPADSPWLVSLVMWASALRHIPDDGITVAALRRAARTGSNYAGLRRWRYVTFDPEPAHGRQPAAGTVVWLTARGREARDGWMPIGGVVEERWRERFGAGTVATLRESLEAVAAQLPAGLPDCLPILGYGLFSRVSEDGGPNAVANTVAGGDVAGLPVWTLLSRVLLAFAAEFEGQSPVSLAICADVLRMLTERGARVRDIPQLAGVSRESVAMAMSILVKQDLATEGPDPAGGRWRVAALTRRGAVAQAAYYKLVADIEDAWRDRFGADTVAGLRAGLERLPVQDLLAGTEPYPEGWRAQVRPPNVLPDYPMVLHRGGYPDGS
jgi:methyltransferase (TIGR00027 family)